MKAIIFGASGQDGVYLTQLLRKKGCDIIAVSRMGGFDKTDITDFGEVCFLVKHYQPDYIFHLAANSTTNHDAAFENHATIATGTLNILEAVKLHSHSTKVFISGSGLQFENKNKPIKESDPFEASNPYSMSRIHAVYTARYYSSLGIKVYVGYFFNHDSPLRTERHMTKKISEAAKRIAKGSTEKLTIGDIEAVKEYTFAGDVVNGIWSLINQDKIVEANISSGLGYSIKDWLEQCFSFINKDWQDHVIIDNAFVPAYKQLVSDPSLIFSLGWKPELSFDDLAKLMMQ